MFPEYGYTADEVVQMSGYALWKFQLTKLRNALVRKQHVKGEVLFHVSLPSKSAHTGNKCGVQHVRTSHDFMEHNPTGL